MPLNKLSLGGTWTAGYEYFTAGPDARLALTLYSRVDDDSAHEATVEIRPAAGIQAYSFTFG